MEDLKDSNYLETKNSNSSKTLNSNYVENTTKLNDFPKRLSKLKKDNPDILKNAANAARNNYN
jgi:hypothetical protein